MRGMSALRRAPVGAIPQIDTSGSETDIQR